jgi:hypothetical protein
MNRLVSTFLVVLALCVASTTNVFAREGVGLESRIDAIGTQVLGERPDALERQMFELSIEERGWSGPLANAQITESWKEAEQALAAWQFFSRVGEPYSDRPLIEPPSANSGLSQLERLDAIRRRYGVEDEDMRVWAEWASRLGHIMVVEPGNPTPHPVPYVPETPGMPHVPYTPGAPPAVQDDPTNIGYNPDRFIELGILTESWNGRDLARCTASRVAAGWILTAAHCVARRGDQGEIVWLRGLRFFPNGGTGDQTFYARRWTSDPIRPGEDPVGQRIDGRAAFAIEASPRAFGTPTNFGSLVEHDFVLARLDSSSVSGFAAPANKSALPLPSATRVTLAGYGFTDVGRGQVGLVLRVGWAMARQDGNQVKWISPYEAEGMSGACRGDSGGPIYSGVMQGLENERREIVGVVHNADCALADNHVLFSVQEFLSPEQSAWVAGVIGASN